MELGGVILAVNIILLVCGWVLFQNAKSELTAQSGKLGQIQQIESLRDEIIALIGELRSEREQLKAEFDERCIEAADILALTDQRLAELRAEPADPPATSGSAVVSDQSLAVVSVPVASGSKVKQVLSAANAGLSAREIAHEYGLPMGEVELILDLRPSAAPS